MIRTLKSFTKEDEKEFIKFLRSPYYNTDKEFLNIFNEYLSGEFKNDSDILAKLGKDKSEKFNLLIEKFILLKEFEKDKNSQSMYILSGLQSRDVPKRYKYLITKFRKQFENTYKRDDNYYNNKVTIENEYYKFSLDETKFDYPYLLDEISENIEMNFYFQYLHNVNNKLVHSFFTGKNYKYDLKYLDKIESEIKKSEKIVKDKHPNVYIIYLAVKIVQKLSVREDTNSTIEELKNYLEKNIYKFDLAQLYFYYGYVINAYQLIVINTNDSDTKYKLMEIFKFAEEKGFSYINNILPVDLFTNIVAISLATDNVEWLERFIEKHLKVINSSINENDLKLFYAKIAFAKRNYEETLSILAKIRTNQHIKFFSVKFLYIKSYYELNNHESIRFELENLRKFGERNKNLADRHRKYIDTFRHFIKELIGLKELKEYREENINIELEILGKEINSHPNVVPDKKWLLQKIKDLKT
ncbi:MAG TPA: hypothetical protein PLG90_13020 [Ignavibacteria bacterium]|nr:hypothetical protein [Ignavibacteria bacterium]